jgi:hypothetical protein
MYVIQEGGVRITFHDSHQKLENGESKALASESGDRDSEVPVLCWEHRMRTRMLIHCDCAASLCSMK